MKKTTIRTRIEEFIAYRSELGYTTQYHDTILQSFVRFAESHGLDGPLRRIWVDEFVHLSKGVHSVCYASRNGVLRDFARYWAAYDPRVEIPLPLKLVTKRKRRDPYIYSAREVQLLMKAARSCFHKRTLTGDTYATIIGLMSCTGLRTGEVANLLAEDVDLKQSLLRVRHGKNQLLRLVPIHESTTKALREYAHDRNEHFPTRNTNHFFVNKSGKALCSRVMDSTFKGIRQRAGISAPKGYRQPRLYDLRHTFACNRLLAAIQKGNDTFRFAHPLATYMGHNNIEYTYWYLTGTPALLEAVGQKYEQYVNQAGGAAQ